MLVTNSLIRIVSPECNLPSGFECVRPDLEIHVAELPFGLTIGEREPKAIKVLQQLKEANCACEQCVLFVETVGNSPVEFSSFLRRLKLRILPEVSQYFSEDTLSVIERGV